MAQGFDVVFPFGEDDIEDVLMENFNSVEVGIIHNHIQGEDCDFMERLAEYMRGGAFLHNESVLECAHLAIRMFIEDELTVPLKRMPNIYFPQQ